LKLYKTNALVLRTKDYQEADRLVTLLTWEKGKISSIAKGARKTKSKLAAGVELFTHGNFLLYQGKNLDTVTQVEPLHKFYRLRGSLLYYGYGLYFAELLDCFLVESEPNPVFCNMLLAAWQALETEKVYPPVLARAFEIKLMALLGYRPHLDGCMLCGRSFSNYRFFPGEGGVICLQCASGIKGFSLPCGGDVVSLGRYLLATRFACLDESDHNHSALEQLGNILQYFIADHGGKINFKSRLFLQEITSGAKDKS